MLKRFLLVLAVAAVAGSAAAQQDFFHRPSPLAGRTLLTLSLFDEVRTEIKSTDDQNKKEDALLDKVQQDIMDAVQNGGNDPAAMRPAIEKVNQKYDEEVGKILNADQMKRLRELYVQFNGNAVLGNAAFQKDAGITDDQKTQIKKLQEDQFSKMMEAFGSGDPADAMKKLQDEFNTGVEKLLTDDQKKKMKEMAGAKFEFKKVAAGGGQ